MNAVRFISFFLGSIGLVASTFSARPAMLDNFGGWAFALIWVSAAWLLLCIASLRPTSITFVTGALFGLGASEILLFFGTPDPLMHAIKPIYQIPLATICGGAAFYAFKRVGEKA